MIKDSDKNKSKLNNNYEEQEEKVYREFLSREIINKVKKKITNNDPNIMKSIRKLLSEDDKK